LGKKKENLDIEDEEEEINFHILNSEGKIKIRGVCIV
jgi:hypothetical protein